MTFALPNTWVYALRTCAAALAALYLAYALQLDTPASAAITVLIVAHPVHGMVWSKSIYRLAGTIVGGVVALLLTALFAQTPELFLLFLGLWLGICTAGAALFRNFKSYGAMLAGYTVGLICFPAITTAPESIFTLTMARVASVSLGITCSALAASLLTRRSIFAKLTAQQAQLLTKLSIFAARTVTNPPHPAWSAEQHALRTEIAGMDGQIECALAEAPEMSAQADRLRYSLSSMFSALTVLTSIHETGDGIGLLPPPLLQTFADAMMDHRTSVQCDPTNLPPQSMPILDHLRELTDTITQAASGMGVAPVTKLQPAYHLDWMLAGRNAVRSTLSVWVCGALWLATAWPVGGMMVASTIPNVVLLSLRDHPEQDALQFAKGIALAAIVALFYLVLVLPHLSNFVQLAVALLVPLFWGTLISTRLNVAFMGLGFLVFFLTLLSPANDMRYDVAGLINMSLAVVAGPILTWMIYRMVLPSHPLSRAAAVLRALHTDLQALLHGRQPIQQATWESRSHHRLLRLASCFGSEESRHPSMQKAQAALRLGRQIIRLRTLSNAPAADATAQALARRALKALRGMATAPHKAASVAEKTAHRLLILADGPSRPMRIQASSALTEIAQLLRRYDSFFLLPSP